MNILIGKSGTGIGKSGTGIGKSGTGVNLVGACMIVLLGILLASSAAAGQSPHLMVSEHQGVISISLHDGSRIVAGQALRSHAKHGFQRIALNDVGQAIEASGQWRPASHGSGSGGASHGNCSHGGLQSHGSGSGGSGQSVDDCPPMLAGSLMSHGSGSGEAVQDDCEDNKTESHGSGSGEATQGSDDCDNDETDSHGSGSGTSSFGGGGCLQSHGSGSGSSGQSVGGCSGGAWGFVEIASDGDHLSLIVYRFERFGAREYLIASGQSSESRRSSEFWVAEP
jgi:hypothetical protein